MKTQKLIKMSLAFVLVQFALNSGVYSQERPVENLDEVVITASRSPKKLSQIGKAVTIITSETLARSQGRTLPEVLNNVAGLTIGGNATNPADIKAVYMRGASPGNTLILLDGVPLNDASEISGEYNISAIPVEQIDRIEILKGGNSTLYGSDAVAGVINIITKKGDSKPSLGLILTGGTFDTFKQVANAGTKINNTSLSLTLSNLDSKGFSTAIPETGESNFDRDGLHQKSLLFNVDQYISDKFSLRANLQANDSRAGLDNGAFSDALNYDYEKKSFSGGIGGRLVTGNGILNFNLNQNNVRNEYDNDGSVTDNTGQITFIEANLNYPLSNFLELAGGVNYRNTSTTQINPFSPELNADNNINNSAFTSFFFSLPTGFNAEIGGRINNHSEFGTNFTYTVNPSYLLADKYKIYLNASSAFRVPSLFQLFSQYGNLDLKPENSTTLEFGFNIPVNNVLSLTASAFQREIENVIDFGEITAGRFGYINQNLQKDKGVELDFQLTPSETVNINAFYAYVDGKVSTPTTSFNNLFRRPKHSYGLTTNWNVSQKLSFSVIYKHTGDRVERYFSNSTFQTIEADLDAFNVWDTYVQYNASKKLTIFADVKNILNEDYVEFSGYQTKGTNFNAGLRFTFL